MACVILPSQSGFVSGGNTSVGAELDESEVDFALSTGFFVDRRIVVSMWNVNSNVDSCIDACVDSCVDPCVDSCVNARMDSYVNTCVDSCVDDSDSTVRCQKEADVHDAA